jgi:hypothetical protein
MTDDTRKSGTGRNDLSTRAGAPALKGTCSTHGSKSTLLDIKGDAIMEILRFEKQPFWPLSIMDLHGGDPGKGAILP